MFPRGSQSLAAGEPHPPPAHPFSPPYPPCTSAAPPASAAGPDRATRRRRCLRKSLAVSLESSLLQRLLHRMRSAATYRPPINTRSGCSRSLMAMPSARNSGLESTEKLLRPEGVLLSSAERMGVITSAVRTWAPMLGGSVGLLMLLMKMRSGSGTLPPEIGVAAAIQNRQHDDVALVWNRQIDDSVGEAANQGTACAAVAGGIRRRVGSESENQVQSDCSIASSTASASRPGSPSAR